MNRMDKTTAGELIRGDRFYQVADKRKTVYEMVAPKKGELMCCDTIFIGLVVQDKKAQPIKAKTNVIFLRNVNN